MEKLKFALLIGTALIAGSSHALAQQKGGVVNVATIGEPPTLDSMVSTADLVGIISQHIFETLYTFDKTGSRRRFWRRLRLKSAPTAKPIRSSCAKA